MKDDSFKLFEPDDIDLDLPELKEMLADQVNKCIRERIEHALQEAWYEFSYKEVGLIEVYLHHAFYHPYELKPIAIDINELINRLIICNDSKEYHLSLAKKLEDSAKRLREHGSLTQEE